MKILLILQWIMGGTLTAGFVAHDQYYVHKYLGITLYSVILLIAILWFHLIIFLEKAGYVEVISSKEGRRVQKIRFWVAILTILICFADCLNNIRVHNQSYFSYKNITATIFSMILVIFPEVVFKIVFVFRRKK